MRDKGLKWDVIKCEIRGLTIKYSKNKAYNQRERDKGLKLKFERLVNEVNNKANDVNLEAELEHVTRELEELNDQKTQAAMLRSKSKWTGEKLKILLRSRKKKF